MEDRGEYRPGSFWNTAKIRENLDRIIDSPDLPLEDTQVEDAACKLRLGPEAYVSGDEGKIVLDPGDMVAIAPGRIALLLTEEKIKLPRYVVGFISLRTGVKLPGLINVSGFHVDPGFEGRLVFTVYNAGTQTCAFIRGQRMFLIWLAELSDPEDGERTGGRQRQDTIPADDISRLTTAGASPAELNARIGELEIKHRVYIALLLALVVAVVTMFIGG